MIRLNRLTAASQLRVLPVPETHISFLREAFLKKGIAFGTGDYGVLVFIDDMLVGAISYRKPMFAGFPLYVLTDLVISHEGRLAKLVARVATLRDTFRPFERKLLQRFSTIRTTAYSDYPDAMKYRGSWKVETRKETDDGPAGKYEINYLAEARSETLADAYAWWWKRDGEREVAAARSREQEGRPAHPEAA